MSVFLFDFPFFKFHNSFLTLFSFTVRVKGILCFNYFFIYKISYSIYLDKCYFKFN